MVPFNFHVDAISFNFADVMSFTGYATNAMSFRFQLRVTRFVSERYQISLFKDDFSTLLCDNHKTTKL